MKPKAVGSTPDDIPGVTDDPVLRRVLSGEARTLDEAEEQYLDAALPEVYALLARPVPDADLARDPLLTLLRTRGGRPREDSLS